MNPWKDPTLRSPSDVEKEMKKGPFATKVGDLVTTPAGALQVALESDPRPAETPDAATADDFDIISEE